jgi:hypothetical protein
MMMTLTFNEPAHQYAINGRNVPSVTQVLGDVIPGWKASEWHMQRGRAVHACAAMIADGVVFENDPVIDGQVAACGRYFQEVAPDVVGNEVRVGHATHQYAGTLDLIVRDARGLCVIDYKATLTLTVPYQLAAYALAYEHMHKTKVRFGYGVQLNESGTYKMSEVYDLRRVKQEWLCVLGAYRVRRKCRVKEVGE